MKKEISNHLLFLPCFYPVCEYFPVVSNKSEQEKESRGERGLLNSEKQPKSVHELESIIRTFVNGHP